MQGGRLLRTTIIITFALADQPCAQESLKSPFLKTDCKIWAQFSPKECPSEHAEWLAKDMEYWRLRREYEARNAKSNQVNELEGRIEELEQRIERLERR